MRYTATVAFEEAIGTAAFHCRGEVGRLGVVGIASEFRGDLGNTNRLCKFSVVARFGAEFVKKKTKSKI